MKNIFLTGEKGIGKSTLLFKILNLLDCSIGGYYEKKITCEDGIKFDMISLYDGSFNNIIGIVDLKSLRPQIFEEVFESVGVDIIDKSLKNRDCIVMDEIGFFESKSEGFKRQIFRALDSNKPVIGVLKKCSSEFISEIKQRDDVVVFEVTLENRDFLLNRIIGYVKSLGIPIKGKRTFNIDKKSVEEYLRDINLDINDYPKKILEYIKDIVGNFHNLTVLDIGSGPGTFSIPVAKLGAEVVAVDSSIYMFDALIDRIKKENLNNIKCHLSPWETFEPPLCDVAICAFAANSLKEERQFKKLYEKTNKYIFIITQTLSKEYEFGLNKVLKALNINIKENKPYLSLAKMLLDYESPFIINFSEVDFHKSFEKDEDIYEFICQRLNIKLDKKFLFKTIKEHMLKYGGYVLLLNTKKCAVITIIKGDKYEGKIYR